MRSCISDGAHDRTGGDRIYRQHGFRGDFVLGQHLPENRHVISDCLRLYCHPAQHPAGNGGLCDSDRVQLHRIDEQDRVHVGVCADGGILGCDLDRAGQLDIDGNSAYDTDAEKRKIVTK